jgi:Fur family ferric uptake transcriptional regulator
MDWQDKLTNAGYRISQPRCIVMEVLSSAKVPLAPLAVLKRAQSASLCLGMVSVYRTLDLLTKLGLVTLVHLEDGSQGYVLASAGHHHHIVCRSCEQVFEFSGTEDLDELISRVQQETGFEVSDHLLQLYGLCPACQKAQKG